jgi:hypothetical protein
MLTVPGLPNCLFVREGQFDTDAGSNAAQLEQLFEAYEASGRKTLIVYFHGGLVDTDAALAAAAALIPAFEASNAFPVFVIWETGWAEIIDQNLPSIFGEKIFQRLVARVTQFVKGKLDKAAATGQSKGPGDLPLDMLQEIEVELKKLEGGVTPFGDLDLSKLPRSDELTEDEAAQIREQILKDLRLETHVEEIANARQEQTGSTPKGATASGLATTLMDLEVAEEIAPSPEDGSKGLISMAMLAKHVVVITAASIRRLATKRDHGVYLTIVEEILRELYVRAAGKFLWDRMKKAVDEAFGAGDSRVGRTVIEHLKATWAAGDRTVILVGHSAGSIYVCRLLQEIDHANLPESAKANVVFVAPACTFDLLERTVTGSGDRISGLRIFGMNDELERRDALAGFAYPASLLYFVSGVLEDGMDVPLAGMERYYLPPYEGQDFAAIQSTRKFALLKKAHATVWSPRADGQGANCDMTSHGGWLSAPKTLESVQYIIREGYGHV